jgi:hypothetical protein
MDNSIDMWIRMGIAIPCRKDCRDYDIEILVVVVAAAVIAVVMMVVIISRVVPRHWDIPQHGLTSTLSFLDSLTKVRSILHYEIRLLQRLQKRVFYNRSKNAM